MKNAFLKFIFAFVVVVFVGCESLPDEFNDKHDMVKEWVKPKSVSASKDAKIKAPYLAIGTGKYSDLARQEPFEFAGYIMFVFKEKSSKTKVHNIKINNGEFGVWLYKTKDKEKLNTTQLYLLGDTDIKSLKNYYNDNESVQRWNTRSANVKQFWEKVQWKGGSYLPTNCRAESISTIELVTDDGTFTYKFR